MQKTRKLLSAHFPRDIVELIIGYFITEFRDDWRAIGRAGEWETCGYTCTLDPIQATIGAYEGGHILLTQRLIKHNSEGAFALLSLLCQNMIKTSSDNLEIMRVIVNGCKCDWLRLFFWLASSIYMQHMTSILLPYKENADEYDAALSNSCRGRRSALSCLLIKYGATRCSHKGRHVHPPIK